MRLDKYLAEAGLGSRSQVKNLLKKKQVKVNGLVESSPKRQIQVEEDQVQVGGQTLSYDKYLYYLLNKPKGYLSARQDSRQKTVLDLLEPIAFDKGVFPVGRLDIDTHGLLFLTNNGDLAHAMLSPKKHVNKRYRAQVEGLMDEADRARFAEGIAFKDFTSLPAQLEILDVDEEKGTSLVEVVIAEGKYHQVKRMVAACGKKVLDLERLSMGPLVLDSQLKEGTYRRLTAEELASLEIFQVPLK